MTEATLTLGEQMFGVVVNGIKNPSELDQRTVTVVFGQFVSALRHLQNCERRSLSLSAEDIALSCDARARARGFALQLAQMLAWEGRVWPVTRAVDIKNEDYAKSADGLIALVGVNWLQQLPEIPLDDDTAWEHFLKAAEAFEQGNNATSHIEALVAHNEGDFHQLQRYAKLYAEKVAPEWRLWLKGVPDVTLPRF